MKVDRISYQKTFPLAPYVNEKIGVEIQLDGDSPEQALYNAKKIVEEWHKQSNPHLVYNEPDPYTIINSTRNEEKETADKQFEYFKKKIDSLIASNTSDEDINKWVKNNGWGFSAEAKNYIQSKKK